MEPAVELGIHKWICTGTYVPTARTDGDGVLLSRTPATPFVRAVNFDYERFALSSKESYANVLSEWTKYYALGWPVLKMYYASFFAAHAIMRSRGAGIVKLEKTQTDHINALMDAYSVAGNSLGPGMYVLRREIKGPLDAPDELSISIRPQSGGKGVHDGFWREFSAFIEAEASDAVEQGAPNAQLFLSLSVQLTDAIKSGGSGSVWLSAMRNEINYQHKHDVWFPYRKVSEAYQSIVPPGGKPSMAALQLSTSKEKTPIKASVHVACFLSSLSIEIGDTIAVRSTKGNAFGQKWRRLTETAM